jgi:hypothetical protein
MLLLHQCSTFPDCHLWIQLASPITWKRVLMRLHLSYCIAAGAVLLDGPVLLSSQSISIQWKPRT